MWCPNRLDLSIEPGLRTAERNELTPGTQLASLAAWMNQVWLVSFGIRAPPSGFRSLLIERGSDFRRPCETFRNTPWCSLLKIPVEGGAVCLLSKAWLAASTLARPEAESSLHYLDTVTWTEVWPLTSLSLMAPTKKTGPSGGGGILSPLSRMKTPGVPLPGRTELNRRLEELGCNS